MENKEKSKKLYLIIGIVVVVIVTIVGAYLFINKGKVNEDSALYKAYEKSLPSEEMNGYILDLRIYGVYKKENISEIARVNNYKGTNILITTLETTGENPGEIRFLIDNQKMYSQQNGEFKTTNEEIPYVNIVQVLDTIKDAKINKEQKETLASVEYSTYSVTFDKSSFEELFKNTILEDYKINKDIEGKIWIDEDGYVYRIEYYFDKTEETPLEVDATYFEYNHIDKINI